jgi:hypothetical protein
VKLPNASTPNAKRIIKLADLQQGVVQLDPHRRPPPPPPSDQWGEEREWGRSRYSRR